MAAGAILAGAAIPIAAAGTAWADIDISYDGKTIYDNFPNGEDPAQSGTHNDLAVVIGPASDGTTSSAIDTTGDKNDFAVAINGGSADLTDASNSKAITDNGGLAEVVEAHDSQAIANDGGIATVYKGDDSTAKATDANSFAAVGYSNDSTATAKDGGVAIVGYSDDSWATAVGEHHGVPSEAFVFEGDHASATAFDGASAWATGPEHVFHFMP
jgi:hypothetical protein